MLLSMMERAASSKRDASFFLSIATSARGMTPLSRERRNISRNVSRPTGRFIPSLRMERMASKVGCAISGGRAEADDSRLRAIRLGASSGGIIPFPEAPFNRLLSILRCLTTVVRDSPRRISSAAQSATIASSRSHSCRLWPARKQSSSERVRLYFSADSAPRPASLDWKNPKNSLLVCRFASTN